MSLRRAEQDIKIQRSSIHGMVRNRLPKFPYKLHIAQHPEDRDYEARINITNLFLQNIEADKFFLSRIIYSDDCVLHMNGKVNKHKVNI